MEFWHAPLLEQKIKLVLMIRNCQFLIDNLASADASFEYELYSNFFFIDTIDLIIVSPIKGIKIDRKHIPQCMPRLTVDKNVISIYYINLILIIEPLAIV